MGIIISIWILFLIQIVLIILIADLNKRIEKMTCKQRALLRLLRSKLNTTVNILTDAGIVTGVLQKVGNDGIQLEESSGDLVIIPITSIRAILS